jgi:hypothetical protein
MFDCRVDFLGDGFACQTSSNGSYSSADGCTDGCPDRTSRRTYGRSGAGSYGKAACCRPHACPHRMSSVLPADRVTVLVSLGCF